METLQAIYFGQKHAEFDFKDFAILQRIARLSKKHQHQCENACNGYGVVNGQMFYGGAIDDYAKQSYGFDVKSSYIKDDFSVFDKEIDKIELKIAKLADGINQTKYALWRVKPFTVEFQHDPRGWTVKLFYEKDFINW